MQAMLAELDPYKLVLPVVALLGLVPIVLQYRHRAKWFAVGYVLLVVATLATNVENLMFGNLLNYTEHVVGLLGSGAAFFVAAYVRRQRILAEHANQRDEDTDPANEVNA